MFSLGCSAENAFMAVLSVAGFRGRVNGLIHKSFTTKKTLFGLYSIKPTCERLDDAASVCQVWVAEWSPPGVSRSPYPFVLRHPAFGVSPSHPTAFRKTLRYSAAVLSQEKSL